MLLIRVSAVILYHLMCHCFIAEEWLWILRSFADQAIPLTPWKVSGVRDIFCIHMLWCINLALTELQVDLVGFLWWVRSIREDRVCNEARTAWRADEYSSLKLPRRCVCEHTLLLSSHTHMNSISSCSGALQHVLMTLASFCWVLTAAVLPEKSSTDLGDRFY